MQNCCKWANWRTNQSNSNEQYSQRGGKWIGAKGKPTKVGYDNPALKATYRFITGKDPDTLKILPEPNIVRGRLLHQVGQAHRFDLAAFDGGNQRIDNRPADGIDTAEFTRVMFGR